MPFKFHYDNEAASMMAGLEIARLTIGIMEYKSGNMERAANTG